MPKRYGISADHIASSRGGFEPQRKNNFTILVPMAGDVLALAVHSVSFPSPGVGELEIPFGNEKRYVAGQAEFEDLDLQIKDFIGGRAANLIKAWRRLVYNVRSGAIGLAGSYKRNCSLVWFGPDGSNQRVWTCVGVWPSACSPGGGDMSDSKQNMIGVTLTIDKAYIA